MDEIPSDETNDEPRGLGCTAVVMPAIRPGIVTQDGTTIYPTGIEWLLAFAVNGCQWAVDALPENVDKETHMRQVLHDVERDKFEKWISAEPYQHSVMRVDDGKYQSHAVEIAWQSWQQCWYELRGH